MSTQVDENTGEARAAPPPEVRDDDASSVGLCKKWHADTVVWTYISRGGLLDKL